APAQQGNLKKPRLAHNAVRTREHIDESLAAHSLCLLLLLVLKFREKHRAMTIGGKLLQRPMIFYKPENKPVRIIGISWIRIQQKLTLAFFKDGIFDYSQGRKRAEDEKFFVIVVRSSVRKCAWIVR